MQTQLAKKPAKESRDYAADSLGPAHARPETTELASLGAYFHHRGWSLGTSSNYSVVLGRDPLRLLITASGRDKGRLSPSNDFVIVDETGQAAEPDGATPSAETLLHVVLARRPDVGAVLHTHSVWGTLLSDWHYPQGFVTLEGYEMLKGLAGVGTHEHRLDFPIFANTQDIAALAGQIGRRLDDSRESMPHGFLIHRHGLYTWGRDLHEAQRHVEILEFLFEVVGRTGREGSERR